MFIILDAFPASSTGKRSGKTPTLLDHCRQWIGDCEAAGHIVMVPAVTYYEVLRELELRDAQNQIARLKAFCLHPGRFIPLTTGHLEAAAQLWAKARKTGMSTADPQALDGDVILAAQALSLGLPVSDFIIATTNPGHISRFAPCDLWTNIEP
jgi:predicted nucleic acid-binding protein